MKVALYARVSKKGEQHPENQIIELKRWAESAGHDVEGIYIDKRSTRDRRPQKEEVLRMLRLGYIDAVAFIALDRWGRNITELVLEMEEFSGSGKRLMSLREGFDLGTAGGRLGAHVVAAFANFERDRIQERTIAGLERRKAQGGRLGRHPKNCKCKLHRKTSPAKAKKFIEVVDAESETDVFSDQIDGGC